MFAKRVLLAAAAATAAVALPPDVKPTLDSIHVAAAHCTADCRPLQTISRALDIALDASAATLGAARPLPRNRDRIATREFAKLLSHSNSNDPAAVCNASRALAARYPGPDGSGETFVAVTLIELAARIDAEGTPCLAPLLAAFPRTPQSDTAIGNARMLCISAWHLGPQCAPIVRPS